MLGSLALSSVAIFMAELGDKSQLMAMTFATRYRAWQVLVGITLATTVVHAVSVALGFGMGGAPQPGGDTSTLSSPAGPRVGTGPDVGTGPSVGTGPNVGSGPTVGTGANVGTGPGFDGGT